MKTVLILANDFSTIYSFRRELVSKLCSENYKVYIALPKNEKNILLANLGCEIIETKLSRFGTNFVAELKSIYEYIKIIRRVRPNIVLTYTVKPNIYGGFACIASKVPYVSNVTGLSSVFQEESFLKKVLFFMQKIVFEKAQKVFFQNQNNMNCFFKNGLMHDNFQLIPGSGVNLNLFQLQPYPENNGVIKFVTVSRIRYDKGFDELFEVIGILKSKYDSKLEFHIIGGYDDSKYESKVSDMIDNNLIVYYGAVNQEELPVLLSQFNCLIHPSHHEGMANVLLELASIGRPVLASNIPGCIEAFDEGITGFGFEARDVESLIGAIEKFISLSYNDKIKMGLSGRKKMENEFDRSIIIDSYLNEINKVIMNELI